MSNEQKEMSFIQYDGEKITVPIKGRVIVYPGGKFHMIAIDDPEALEQLLQHDRYYLRDITISGGKKPEGNTDKFLEEVNSTLLPTRFLQGSKLCLKKIRRKKYL